MITQRKDSILRDFWTITMNSAAEFPSLLARKRCGSNSECFGTPSFLTDFSTTREEIFVCSEPPRVHSSCLLFRRQYSLFPTVPAGTVSYPQLQITSVFSAYELLNSSTGEVGHVNLPVLPDCDAVGNQELTVIVPIAADSRNPRSIGPYYINP